nr:type III pantothenate kinase [Halorhodospira neutriphila]
MLVDAGNTRLKWARLSGGRLTGHGAADCLEAAWAQGLEAAWSRIPPPARVLGVCVASQARRGAVEAVARRLWRRTVEWIEPAGQGWGVINAYAEPALLGADRWAALIGARRCAPQGACIVDAGTAITVDGLDAEGRHLGGAIFPGRELLVRTLSQGTGRIEMGGAFQAAELPGRSTEAAVYGGARYGVAAAARALVEQVCPACPPAGARLATGGGADWLLPELPGAWQRRPALVLEGLAAVAEAS